MSEIAFRKDRGYSASCKVCVNSKRNGIAPGAAMSWEYRVGKIKTRAKAEGIFCDLTAEQLESLWVRQEGRCAYTGEPMLTQHGNRNNPLTLSVDRRNPDKGYTYKNVVLCTLRANTIKSNMTMDEFKSWLPSWYERGKKYE